MAYLLSSARFCGGNEKVQALRQSNLVRAESRLVRRGKLKGVRLGVIGQ